MRGYEKSHPWITFNLNMGDASPEVWMLMGEAQSRCEHVAAVPLLPSVFEEFSKVYLIKGALATTAIEGNTLTEEQGRALLENKLHLPPSLAYQQQEVANIIEGYNLIEQKVISGEAPYVTLDGLRLYNRLILQKIQAEEDVIPGEIRTHSVVVGNVYRGAPPEDCEFLFQRLCDWLNNLDQSFESPYPQYRQSFEILKAIVAHLYLAWIHPFGDGNGRTARMVEFEILLMARVPAVSAHLLSNFYNKTRSEYYRHLMLASEKQNPMIFIRYALQGFVDELKLQIDLIKNQQITVHLRDYMNTQLSDRDTVASQRQRKIALALSTHSEPVKLSEIRYLTPQIAEAYADKGWRTIDRDIKALLQRGLIIIEDRGYRINLELMLGFRSPIRPE